MELLITNGRVIDPANGIDSNLNILVRDGKIAALTRDIPRGDFTVIDAKNRVVTPGFIDIHMHEAPVCDLGDMESSIFGSMLRMGVTTAVGGNCGDNELPPEEYWNAVSGKLPVNLALMAGHGSARRQAGFRDKYASLSPKNIKEVAKILRTWLDQGCFGISYGIRYIPGINREELMSTARLCKNEKLLISAHVRDDADFIFESLEEFLELGWVYDIPCQVSHIGSMGGYGQMAGVLSMLDEARHKGLDVMADCYPYSAFSTSIGATTYDPGFMERYRCGYDAIILCGGKYDGQHCTEEIFHEMRREAPGTLTVAHVMAPEDVALAMAHPSVMLASDGITEGGSGHPRAAGSFPRLIDRYVRSGVLTLYQAVEKMTHLPARRLGLAHKGNLSIGSDADLVIFDPDTICDKATFAEPSLAPEGIDYVILGGEIACRNGGIVNSTLGKPVRRK